MDSPSVHSKEESDFIMNDRDLRCDSEEDDVHSPDEFDYTKQFMEDMIYFLKKQDDYCILTKHIIKEWVKVHNKKYTPLATYKINLKELVSLYPDTFIVNGKNYDTMLNLRVNNHIISTEKKSTKSTSSVKHTNSISMDDIAQYLSTLSDFREIVSFSNSCKKYNVDPEILKFVANN